MKQRVSGHAKSLLAVATLIFVTAIVCRLQYTHYTLANRLSLLETTQQSRSTQTGGIAVPGTPCPTSLQPGQAVPVGCSSSASSPGNSSVTRPQFPADGSNPRSQVSTTAPPGGANSSSTQALSTPAAGSATPAASNSTSPPQQQPHASFLSDWVFTAGSGSEESSAHLNAILDAEASRNDTSDRCKALAGSEVVHQLRRSGKPMCQGPPPSIKVYGMQLPNRERPMRVAVLQNASFGPDGFHVACSPVPEYEANRNMGFTDKQYVSTRLLQDMHTHPQPTCSDPKGVLLLVSANDYWNWWWFLVQLQNAFITLAAVSADIDVSGPRTVMFLEKDNREDQETYGRAARQPLPFRELYLHMFASRNTPDVRIDINPSSAYGCYRSVVFLRNAESGSPILKNIIHPFATCYSPIITALVAYIKASVNLPSVAPPAIPTVCWMSRDENIRPEFTPWQKTRTIKDQAGLVAELNRVAASRGVRVVELAFYGNHSSVPIAEQLHRTSRCSLVTGMHGAGLYAAIAMNRPAILELSINRIPNKNAINLMSHIGGCYQGLEIVPKTRNSTLSVVNVWPKVEAALDKCRIVQPRTQAPVQSRRAMKK